MTDRFKDSVAGIVDVLIDEIRPECCVNQRYVITNYLVDTIRAMPDYMQFGFRTLTSLFYLASFVRHGKYFADLSPQRRLAHVNAWRNARLSFKRSLLAFYTTFTTFGVYSVVNGAST
jgi:hypothetical protein